VCRHAGWYATPATWPRRHTDPYGALIAPHRRSPNARCPSGYALLVCPDAVLDHWRGVRTSVVATARCAVPEAPLPRTAGSHLRADPAAARGRGRTRLSAGTARSTSAGHRRVACGRSSRPSGMGSRSRPVSRGAASTAASGGGGSSRMWCSWVALGVEVCIDSARRALIWSTNDNRVAILSHHAALCRHCYSRGEPSADDQDPCDAGSRDQL
jgi:hypothetical protein